MNEIVHRPGDESCLRVFAEDSAAELGRYSDKQQMQQLLSAIGVEYCQWPLPVSLSPTASAEQILAAYQQQVERLMLRDGLQSVDVISMTAEHPQRAELRAKFLNEHQHSEHEIRFFVRGAGLFYMHSKDKVYAVVCSAGDLISVPAGMKHWFDMGAAPEFTAIRLFTNPEGWVAQFTGDPIAERFPRFNHLQEFAGA